ncbi:MAG TPA: NAD-dependent DNA ligase LigA [Verrucomicrobiales bacterium]|nr:NAD-dependent DNA ligase LigA [Verrucomicrobiales bacterium]
MDLSEAMRRVADLSRTIRHHDYAYYVLAQPELSDRDYDLLYRKLLDLEKAFPASVLRDSPSQRVGGQPQDGFESFRHSVPMLSLDNTYSIEEVRGFLDRVQRLLPKQELIWVVEPKADGVAVSLRFENGEFKVGATRGDGTVGDNITANLKTIKSIPLVLRDAGAGMGRIPVCEVRGEVYLSRSGFLQMNEERRKAGEAEFANPRNACTGSLKQLDPRIAAKRPMDIVIYGIGEISGLEEADLHSHSTVMALLNSLGFRTPNRTWTCHTESDLLEAIKDLERNREGFEYEIDGAVIKLDSLMQREIVGHTAKAPRWAMAFKYAAERAITILKGITIQVGRTGALTPVAELEPTLLAGSTISRATLHNEEDLNRKGVRIGDHVVIEKAGEVIPAVVSVVKDRRRGDERVFQFPGECPACGTEVVQAPGKSGGGVIWRCPNRHDCPAQIRGRLELWCSRRSMDIESGGTVLIRQLVDAGLAKDSADLYDLQSDQIVSLERMGEKSARNFLEGLQSSKKQDLWRLVFGLGISNVGAGVAKTLCRSFAALDEIAAADAGQLAAIHEIGDVIASSISEWFGDEANQRMIERLREQGLKFKSELYEDSEDSDKPLTGKTFVLTGTLPQLKRNEATARIEAAGGKVSGSVSKKTSYILAGADPGSKLEKARKLEVTILDEASFLQLLEQ